MTKPELTREQLRELMSHMVERVYGSTEQGLQAAYELGWKARGKRDRAICADQWISRTYSKDGTLLSTQWASALACEGAIYKEDQ